MVDPDLQDIQATLAGDGAAYGRLVRRHQEAVTKRMWRFVRDPQRLEELVHDVFVEAYVSLKGFRGEAPFTHWLSRIATRVGYHYWKKRDTAVKDMPLQDWDALAGEEEASAMEASEAAQVLHDMLGQLPPRDRLVLTLMYLEELSVAQVAEQTGWSVALVKVQAFRARKKLKALIDKANKEHGHRAVFFTETQP
ncbi:MAG: RNA polymerase sigma factor [Planctomycetota bacterium]|nr:RNA polymerase sigma factor [Planctomycetota bacterium]